MIVDCEFCRDIHYVCDDCEEYVYDDNDLGKCDECRADVCIDCVSKHTLTYLQSPKQ